MLEGENQVDNCKQKLSLAESKEAKLRKEYKKAFKREQASELGEVEAQLKQATHARDLAAEESKFTFTHIKVTLKFPFQFLFISD